MYNPDVIAYDRATGISIAHFREHQPSAASPLGYTVEVLGRGRLFGFFPTLPEADAAARRVYCDAEAVTLTPPLVAAGNCAKISRNLDKLDMKQRVCD